MKLLLIGKNGQLGAEIDRQAREKGIDILSFGRDELDVTDNEKLAQMIDWHKPNVVINASAYHVVGDCETYPDKAFLINSIALKPLAEICERSGITLVHYSTDYVFNGLKGSEYEEEDKPQPLQMYGISKLAGEHVVLRYAPRTGIVIRPCGVYGGQSGSRQKKGNFVLKILEQAKEKKEIEVSSEEIVSPTYSVDLAAATLELLRKDGIKGIYHLVNEGHCSWAEFASEIIRIKGLDVTIVHIDRGGQVGDLRRPLFSALKNVKAKELGIVLPSWQDGLRRYLKSLDMVK